MKKRIFSALVLSIAAIMLLLSGCMGATPLSFTNAFYGSTNNPVVGYSETVIYSVKSQDEYDDLKKDDEITDELIKYNIEGTFTTSFTVLNRIPDKYNEEIQTDLDFEDESRKLIYHYQTTLDVKATYTVSGQYSNYTGESNVTDNSDGSKTYHDVIESEAFFFTSSQSLSPIWSKNSARYTYLTASNDDGQAKVNVITLESNSKTTFNKSNYTIYNNYVIGAQTDKAVESTKTYGYTQKTVIDNTQLLFAIRNVDVAEDSSYSLPTVSPAYGASKTLTIKNNGDKQKTLDMTYNANTVAEEVAVKDCSFYLNTTNDSGTPQYVLVQKSASANGTLPAKALVIEYVEPLAIYGSFQRLGALVYTIKSVTIN